MERFINYFIHVPKNIVIPAKAGIHRRASARRETLTLTIVSDGSPHKAGMTKFSYPNKRTGHFPMLTIIDAKRCVAFESRRIQKTNQKLNFDSFW